MTEPSSEESLDLRFSCLRSSNDFSFSNPLPPTYFRHEPSPCPLGDPGDEMLSLNVVNELAKVTFGQYVGYARKWTSFSLPQTSILGSLARAPGSTHAAGPPRREVRGRSEGPSGEQGAPRGHPEHGRLFRHFRRGKQGPQVAAMVLAFPRPL